MSLSQSGCTDAHRRVDAVLSTIRATALLGASALSDDDHQVVEDLSLEGSDDCEVRVLAARMVERLRFREIVHPGEDLRRAA